MIYVISTFEKVSKDKNGFPNYGDIRSVGWYSSYYNAENAIINNRCDIWERCYDYAVLETLPEGMYPTTCNGYECKYFKYNQITKMYEPINKDEVEITRGIQTWSIG